MVNPMKAQRIMGGGRGCGAHLEEVAAVIQGADLQRFYPEAFTAATSSRCFRVCSSVPHDALRFHGVHHSPSPPAIQWGQLAGLPENPDCIQL